MNKKLKGYLAAVAAAATYGTIPALAVPLYSEGMNPSSVLLLRYLLGLPLVAGMVLWRGRSLRLPAKSVLSVVLLGIMMALSSVCLFESYLYINSGVASTLLFIYPVMVAVIMGVFFHERMNVVTWVCLGMMCLGVSLLTLSDGGMEVNVRGVVLATLSALTYALYMVMVNVNKRLRAVAPTAMLFWVLASGSVVFVAALLITGSGLTLPASGSGWLNIIGLTIVPTVVSLSLTTIAIQNVGATVTAIFGALEPVTAVALSYLVLQQGLTMRQLYGALMILISATLVVSSEHIEHVLLRARRMLPSLRRHR